MAGSRGRLVAVVGRNTRLVWSAARRQLLQLLAFQIVSAIAFAVELASIGALVAALVDDRAPSALVLGALGVALATNGVIGALVERSQGLLAEQVTRDALGRILDVTTRVPVITFDDAQFHDRLERASHNAEERAWTAVWGTVQLTGAVTSVAGAMVVLAGVSPLLVVVVVAGVVPLLLVNKANRRDAYAMETGLTANDRERQYLTELLTSGDSAGEVRLFGAAGVLRSTYEHRYDQRLTGLAAMLDRRVKRTAVAAIANAVVLTAAAAALAGLARSDQLGIDEVGVAVIALQQLAVRLKSVAAGVGAISECAVFVDDMFTFTDLAASFPEPVARPVLRGAPSRICVDDVSFTYPGSSRRAVDGVSLTIEPGQIVALVGENGSGKTTLAKMVCGLLEPAEGTISGVRPEQVGAMFQSFVRFHLSAETNVVISDPAEPSDVDRLARAIQGADLASVVGHLSDGLDTRLGREWLDGAELSGGQWQRVALARALYRDAPVLVLDEPTAALDPRAEAELLSDMRQLTAGRSVLLITHRLAGVVDADQILVLHEGRVVEHGTHGDLVRAGGRYAELFALQAERYQA